MQSFLRVEHQFIGPMSNHGSCNDVSALYVGGALTAVATHHTSRDLDR